MEFKKNPRVDIHRKKSLFFNIGLVIALFVVNSAFEWTTYDEASRIDLEVNKATINNFDATQVIAKEATPPAPITKTKLTTAKESKKKTLAEEMEEIEMSVDLTVDLEMP
jgi:protein TonB